MVFDFGVFLKQKAYACVDTKIGKLCVFGISLNDQAHLYKKLNAPLRECTTSNFMMNLCIYACFPVETLKDKLYKPDAPSLTGNDVIKMSSENLEEIAGVYIDNNAYLFKSRIKKNIKNEKGEAVENEEHGEIEHPRIDGESNASYLHRLTIIESEQPILQSAASHEPALTKASVSMTKPSAIDKALQASSAMERAIAAMARPLAIDKALQAYTSYPSVMEKAMAAMARPSAIDKALQALNLYPSVTEKAMAAMARPSAVDKALQAHNSYPSVMEKSMEAMATQSAIDKALQAYTSYPSVMEKAMAAMARPSAIDKALQAFLSYPSLMEKAIAAMAYPSAIDQALQSMVATNQASLQNALKGFAKASSVILDEPHYLSDMAQVISRIDLNTLDISSIEEELENTEAEFSSIENSATFFSVFSNLHPFIQAILFYFLIHVLLPQVNSISANLLTPMVESYLNSNEKPDREKINEIKHLTFRLKDVNTDDLRFITGNNVRLRASPSTNSEIYDELILGQVVTVLSKQRNWIEVMYEYENGESISGWVFTRYTEKFVK